MRELSVEEIRYWIVRKRNAARRERLRAFWQTGRVRPIVGRQPSDPAWLQTADLKANRRQSTGFDRALLVAEGLAVVSLLAVVMSGLSVLRSLNRSMASALRQPPAQPT